MKHSFSLTFSHGSTTTLLRAGQKRASTTLSKGNSVVSPLCCRTDDNRGMKISSVLTRISVPETVMETGGCVMSPFLSSQAQRVSHDEGIGILKFLKHKVFLITGATGFLGKVLIEKILRTSPDVDKIFVLIKATNKETASNRLQNEIIHTQLFDKLKQIHGNSFHAFISNKLVPVVGNICESNLGLDEDDAAYIASEVNVIINSAANTSFDERYDTALDINTGGPTRILGFAKICHRLKLFVQVSTAYVNGERQGTTIEKPFSNGDTIRGERLQFENQQELLSVENEIKLVHQTKQAHEDNSMPQKMKVLGKQRANKFGWQDTYVFTKAMGEMLIDSLRGNVPVVIIRPSVIESTYNEPFPGWMEGNRMMDPIILHYGKGHLTGFLADPDGVLDVVPADMVVNAILAATAKHGEEGKPETNIYQVASSVVNPLVFKDLAKLLYEHFKVSPMFDSTGRQVNVPPMKLFTSMEDFSTHLWRHAMERTGLGSSERKLSRKLELICRKSVEQAKYLANIYEPYTFYGGRFDNSNTKSLMGCMNKDEKQQFGFDVESIDWEDYISKVHIPGLRRHVMKGREHGN